MIAAAARPFGNLDAMGPILEGSPVLLRIQSSYKLSAVKIG